MTKHGVKPAKVKRMFNSRMVAVDAEAYTWVQDEKNLSRQVGLVIKSS